MRNHESDVEAAAAPAPGQPGVTTWRGRRRREYGWRVAPPRVYLAGPDVFVPNPLEQAERLRAICQKHGMVGCFPLDAKLDLSGLDKVAQGLAISRANEELIRSCNAVLANMTPFRGPSTDVGTAFEIGFARALGKIIVGYTSMDSKYRERVIAHFGETRVRRRESGALEDPDGMSLEDFDLVDNLMLDGAMLHSGGAVIRPSDVGDPGISTFECAARTLSRLLAGEYEHGKRSARGI